MSAAKTKVQGIIDDNSVGEYHGMASSLVGYVLLDMGVC